MSVLCLAVLGGLLAAPAFGSALPSAELVATFESTHSLAAAAHVDGRAFFTMSEPLGGLEPWTSDGSAAGTRRVLDVNPGPVGSSPYELTACQGRLFFFAWEPVAGTEPWVSDGSAAGTRRVLDLRPGGSGSAPTEMACLGASALFVADDGLRGPALWASDGSAAGTRLVADPDPSSGLTPRLKHLTPAGTRLFFAAHDGQHGEELWASDGTAAGTALVADLVPGLAGSAPEQLTDLDGTLLFVAFDPGPGLWRSDGTAAGTSKVAALPGAPAGLRRFRDGVWFVAGGALWRADAASATRIVQLPGRQVLGRLTPAGDSLFFLADDGSSFGWELWRTDGSAAGTQLVKGALGGAEQLEATAWAEAGGRLLFTACDASSGCEPWWSDGTPAGTGPLGDLRAGPDSSSVAAAFAARGRMFLVGAPALQQRALYQVRLPRRPPADFDGDTHADLVWQDASTRRLTAWTLHATWRTGTRTFTPGSGAAGWRAVGSGDAGGDGRPDLLWHNAGTGRLTLWTMNGLTRAAGQSVDTVIDPTWASVGSGDFDGDGRDDVLWRDGSGRLSVLLLDGPRGRGVDPLAPAAPVDASWEATGVGDFDDDGRPDVAFRHRLSGRVSVWLMDGLTRRQGLLLSPDAPAAGEWGLAAVADLDGDGLADLLWRNASSQRLVAWLMNGTTRRVGRFLSPAQSPGAGARLVAPR